MTAEELRHALKRITGLYPTPEQFVVIEAAARELLTIREAGALIITPDENGEWPRWTRELGLWPSMVRLVLDALRDAMPDGLPADPKDLLTSDDREQLWFDLNRAAKARRDAEATARDLPLGDAMPDGET